MNHAELAFEFIQKRPSSPEAALWHAVILQALVDAFADTWVSPYHKQSMFIRLAAVAWLRGTSRDFIEVCDNAGLNPAYVRQRAREIERSGQFNFNTQLKNRITQNTKRRIDDEA